MTMHSKAAAVLKRFQLRQTFIIDLWNNLDENFDWHRDTREEIATLWPDLFEECDHCNNMTPRVYGDSYIVSAQTWDDPAEYGWCCSDCADKAEAANDDYCIDKFEQAQEDQYI